MNKERMKRFLVAVLTFCLLMTQGGMMAFATEGETPKTTSEVQHKTTFEVQHYVMNVYGKYELAKSETVIGDYSKIYTFTDLVEEEYNDGQILCFQNMMESGYPVSMFRPNEDGTSVVQLYYERLMTPVCVSADVDGFSTNLILSEAYYIGATVNLDENWVKSQIKEIEKIAGVIEILGVTVKQDKIKITYENGEYSFVVPVTSGGDYEDFGLYITFHVTEKITFKVEHHVMNEKGNYELLASETRSGYAKDSYPVKNLV